MGVDLRLKVGMKDDDDDSHDLMDSNSPLEASPFKEKSFIHILNILTLPER